jgi:hypothetical protein
LRVNRLGAALAASLLLLASFPTAVLAAPPTVTIDQAAGQVDPTATSPINFTVVFSQPVTGFATGDVSFTGSTAGGSLVGTVSGSGTTYNVAVTGMTTGGTVVASVPAAVAVNGTAEPNLASTSTDNTVDWAFGVTINQAAGQPDPTTTSPINFTVVFGESVTGFTGADVSFTGSTAGGTLVANVTGSGATYNVAVSGMTTRGTVIATIPAGAATNGATTNTASTSSDNTVNWGVAVTINQAAGQADPTTTSPINFTVVFSESVTGFATGDVSFSGSTAGGTLVGTVTGSGTTYNVAVTGMTSSGTVVATIPAGAATNGAQTNHASTSTDNSVTWGVTVTINQAAGQADPTGTSPINFTVVFSASVTGFATGDVSFAGSTAGGTLVGTVSGSGTTYNVAVSGMTTSGVVVASIPAGVASTATNSNLASTSTDNSVTWGLTVTINQAAGQADPTSTSPINFSVVFSSAVTGFAADDVTITGTAGGTKSVTVSGSGANYTVAVSGMTSSGTVTASIAAGRASNGTNTNLASTSTDNTVTWATPAASITLTTSAPTPPGAQNPVILWGQGFNLTAQFAANGANRAFQLQGSRDLITWTTIANLTTDTNGRASLFYTPVTNLYYRAVFAGVPELSAGTSNQVRTVVRQLALLRPTSHGSIRTISRRSSVTFTTTVRPARPELDAARVSFYLYKRQSGVWALVSTRNVIIDSAGLSRTTFTFNSVGDYYVRSQANPTTYNANSVMTPVERYNVR